MRRDLLASRPLAGDAEQLTVAFRGDPAGWLPELTRPGERPHEWQVYVWGGQLGVLVDLTLGGPVHRDAVTWRMARWEPGPPRPLRVPSFDGDLGLRSEPDGSATLVLRGRYQPPGGVLGRAADRLVLHRLARATAHQLLADIAARLAPSRRPSSRSAP
jgi:hypothetical protein